MEVCQKCGKKHWETEVEEKWDAISEIGIASAR